MTVSHGRIPVRSRGCGNGAFTFEVQRFREDLGRGPEGKTFSRRVVVGGDQGLEAPLWQNGEIGLAWKEAAHAANGVLDAALLPGRVRIAEVGSDPEAMQILMTRELGPVIERHGLAERWRQAREQMYKPPSNRVGGFVGRPGGEQDSRLALMHCQHRLAVL